MDAQILKTGGGFDDTFLTAKPKDVKKGKIFIGTGSPMEQVGENEIIHSIEKQMAPNETYNIVPGYHNGSDRFWQDKIREEDGQTVNPGAGGMTINVSGKFLTSDTVIQLVDNLRPEVIMAGVVIGEGDGAITGTYQIRES